MSDNAIVVVKERVGDFERPTLIIIAMSGGLNPYHLREFAEQADEFRAQHPDTPPILFVAAGDGGWVTMQTDDPDTVRLVDELHERLAV